LHGESYGARIPSHGHSKSEFQCPAETIRETGSEQFSSDLGLVSQWLSGVLTAPHGPGQRKILVLHLSPGTPYMLNGGDVFQLFIGGVGFHG